MFPPTKQIVVFANQSREKSVVRNRACFVVFTLPTLLDNTISLLELVKTYYLCTYFHQKVATARYFCVREKKIVKSQLVNAQVVSKFRNLMVVTKTRNVSTHKTNCGWFVQIKVKKSLRCPESCGFCCLPSLLEVTRWPR